MAFPPSERGEGRGEKGVEKWSSHEGPVYKSEAELPPELVANRNTDETKSASVVRFLQS